MASTPTYFKGRSVFLTGATGTVGQVVLERLLRCTSFNRIVLLARPHKQESAAERIMELLQMPLFNDARVTRNIEDLQQWDERVLERCNIDVLEGDLTKDCLGLSNGQVEKIKQTVSVFISCAASVNFDDPFYLLFAQNVLGCLKCLDLANSCPLVLDTGCFVHVSTAYVNDRIKGVVEEKFYPFEDDVEAIYAELTKLSGQQLELAGRRYLKRLKSANLYTLTKGIAEQLLSSRRHKDLKTIIVRPSIVGATYQEPFLGWTAAAQGFGALIALAVFGAHIGLPGDGRNVGDVIPADYVASTILKSASYFGTRKCKDIEIIHASSSGTNPVSWRELASAAKEGLEVTRYKMHSNYKLTAVPTHSWYPSSTIYAVKMGLESTGIMAINALAWTMKPFKFFSLGQQVHTKLSQAARLLKKRQKALNLLHFFITRQWAFRNDQIHRLQAHCPEEDFSLDLQSINWRKWTIAYTEGLIRYFLIPTVDRVMNADKGVIVNRAKDIAEEGPRSSALSTESTASSISGEATTQPTGSVTPRASLVEKESLKKQL